VLLPDQDRALWDRLLLRRGLDSLARAYATDAPVGVYTIQAAIAACHVRAASAEETDWTAIVSLYDVLEHLWPTPVVHLNRAVAVSMRSGPQAALTIVDELVAAGSLAGYPHLASVRGDLLARLGRRDEARAEFERAAALSANARERETFRAQAAKLADG
jgi:predicted RNA polymerase sigma factor